MQVAVPAKFVGRLGDEAALAASPMRCRIRRCRRDELVAIATCQRDGVDDAGVLAIIDTGLEGASGLDMLPAVRWALRLDRKTGRFMRISPARVRCYNEGSSE